MRATEFITELFSPGKNWQWEFRGSEEAVAKFNINGINYTWFAYTYIRDNPNRWEIAFRIEDKKKLKGKTAYDASGTGNEMEVFSTVVDITRAFLEQYKDKVKQITFNSKGESRTSLYTKMVKRLLPNWSMETRPTDYGPEFILTSPEFNKELGEETAQSPWRWTGNEVFRKLDSTMTAGKTQ